MRRVNKLMHGWVWLAIRYKPTQGMWLSRFQNKGYSIPLGYFSSPEGAETGLECAKVAFKTAGFTGLRMCVSIAMEQLIKTSKTPTRSGNTRLHGLLARELLHHDAAFLSRAKCVSNSSCIQLASAQALPANSGCTQCDAALLREKDALQREQVALELLHHALEREELLVEAMNKAVEEAEAEAGSPKKQK